MAFVTLGVVVGIGGQFEVYTWVERRFGDFILFLGRMYVRLGGFEEWVVVDHRLPCFAEAGRQRAFQRGR